MDKDIRPTLSLKAAPKKARLNKGAKNRPKKGHFTSKKAASPKTTQSTDSRLIAFNILDAIIKRQQMLEAAIGNSEGFKELETRDKGAGQADCCQLFAPEWPAERYPKPDDIAANSRSGQAGPENGHHPIAVP